MSAREDRDEIERLREINAELLAELEDMVSLCSCDNGELLVTEYDSASGRMEFAGFRRCARCAKARAVIAKARSTTSPLPAVPAS